MPDLPVRGCAPFAFLLQAKVLSHQGASRRCRNSIQNRKVEPITSKFTQALAMALAAHVHEGQWRKATSIPYVSHLVAVAALVVQYGGDED